MIDIYKELSIVIPPPCGWLWLFEIDKSAITIIFMLTLFYSKEQPFEMATLQMKIL